MSVLYITCSDRSINSQEYKSFEIDAVTINRYMIEYDHLIGCQAYRLFNNKKPVYGGNGYFHSFEALDDAFEVHFSGLN